MNTESQAAPEMDEPYDEALTLPDMAIDPEALLLCALLWMETGTPTTRFVVDYVDPQDFYNPSYARLFSIIAQHVSDEKPVHPATIAGRISAAGTIEPWPGGSHQMFIADLVHLGALPEQAHWYAEQVLSTSYRRQFHTMTQALAHTAEHAPENQLFSIMVEHGKAQRRAWSRRTEFAKLVKEPSKK